MIHQIRSGPVDEAFGCVADQRSCPTHVEWQHRQNGLEVDLPEQTGDSPDCQRFKGGRCRPEGPDGMRVSVEETDIHRFFADLHGRTYIAHTVLKQRGWTLVAEYREWREGRVITMVAFEDACTKKYGHADQAI
ncbi:hypothetical protein [Streptomyces sp. NPDC002952]|uniref:hypothetical protein n=1 Tax=Streptomyces sp. NPDC002952 TaxID=3364673 RepID=UPI003692741A